MAKEHTFDVLYRNSGANGPSAEALRVGSSTSSVYYDNQGRLTLGKTPGVEFMIGTPLGKTAVESDVSVVLNKQQVEHLYHKLGEFLKRIEDVNDMTATKEMIVVG